MSNTLCFLSLPFTLGLVMNCLSEIKESIELTVKSSHLGENKLILVDVHQSLAETQMLQAGYVFQSANPIEPLLNFYIPILFDPHHDFVKS